MIPRAALTMSTSADVNPDLVKERKAASFSTSLMTNILDGGAQKTNRRRYIGQLTLKKKLCLENLLYIFALI